MSPKFVSLIIPLFLFAALTGCAPTFIAPTQGALAQLSVRTPTITTVAVFDDPIECTGGPHPLYSLFTKEKSKWVSIPANKPLTLSVLTSGDLSWTPTEEPITFIPEAGKRYLVESRPVLDAPRPYQIRILNVGISKKGTCLYSPIRFIKRKAGAWATCDDKEMKVLIKRISTSYQKT